MWVCVCGGVAAARVAALGGGRLEYLLVCTVDLPVVDMLVETAQSNRAVSCANRDVDDVLCWWSPSCRACVQSVKQLFNPDCGYRLGDAQ